MWHHLLGQKEVLAEKDEFKALKSLKTIRRGGWGLEQKF